MFIKENNQF